MTDFEKTLATISVIFGCTREKTHPWFVSFGSLLYLIRDHKHGIEFNQDIDVTYFGQDYEFIRQDLIREGYEPINKVLDEVSRRVLHEEWRSPDGVTLDVFQWIKARGKYWHTYDFYMQRPENGIPSKYVFKDLPEKLFNTAPYRYEFMYDEYTMIPKYYGSLLDYWYPGWIMPDPDFGQSHATETLILGGCKELCQ